MAEMCPKCSVATARVEIGGRSYCASCGETATLHKPVASRSMSDLGMRASGTVSARSATDLHQRKGLAKGGVVDLRTPRPEILKSRAPRQQVKKIDPIPTIKPEVQDKLAVVKQHSRSEKISRFHRPVPEKTAVIAQKSASKRIEAPKHKLPAHTETHHRAMSKLAKTHQHTPKPQARLRYAALGTAVLVMMGYVWLQNYPKLELHSASGKAGFALTLPSYLPSSYSLTSHVDAIHGSAVMSFNSPSNPNPLKITQTLTNWDSSSLRDNIVASQSSDFTAVEGQGLTIYIWGKAQAAWVNHGIRYGIDGASQLSREQILKIAYSL